MIVTICGGSGFVGQHLIQSLLCDNEIVVLCRDTKETVNKLKNSELNLKPFLNTKIFVISYKETMDTYSYLYGKSYEGIDNINLYIIKIHDNKNKIDIFSIFTKLINSDVIVNLAGENISNRFIHNKRVEELLKSRINVTKDIYNIFSKKECFKEDRLFIQASATGFYEENSKEIIDENSPPGKNFLSDICIQNEKNTISLFGQTNTSIIRLGVVIAKNGGLFKVLKSLPAITLLSNRYLPYIYIDDVCLAIQHIMVNHLSGVFNFTTPEYGKTKKLLNVLNYRRHIKLPVFPFMINIGDKRGFLLTTNQKIKPKALLNTGYKFKVENTKDLLEYIKRRE